jgi:hypothetical protein
MEVRLGEIALPDVLAALHDEAALLERAILDSELPEEADHGAIDEFLVSAYQRAWAEDL